MGLFTGLFTLPLAPVRGTVWIAERALEQAQREASDEGAVRRRLLELEMRRDSVRSTRRNTPPRRSDF